MIGLSCEYFLHDAFDCMLSSFKSESMLFSLPEYQGTRSKRNIYSFNDSYGIRNQNHLVCKWTQPFCQTSKIIELYCEYLSLRCIWL